MRVDARHVEGLKDFMAHISLFEGGRLAKQSYSTKTRRNGICQCYYFHLCVHLMFVLAKKTGVS